MKKNIGFLLALISLVSCNNQISTSTSQTTTDSTTSQTTTGSTTSQTTTSEDSSSSEENYDTLQEVMDNLNSSAFSSDYICKENIGLSDMKNVGVNKQRFENEKLYNVPEGTIYLAEDYNITPNGSNNSGNLSILLNNLVNVKGNKIIKFKQGIYKFSATVDVNGIEDVYLVGDNTEFLYSGWGTYFEAKVSKNVNIMNISFDMEYSPTIAGTVKSVIRKDNNPVVILDIPDEFDLSQSIYQNWGKKTCSYMECYYDDITGGYVPNRNGNLFYNSPSSSSLRGVYDIEYTASSRELAITLNENFEYRTKTYEDPKIGTKVSFAYTMYENHGFHFVNCENVYFENVNVYVTGGMGFRVEGGKNVYLNRTNFATKKGSNRIMTCTADIIHTIALEGDLNITNCLLEGSHDDALNIKSFYTKVTNVNASSKEIDIAQTQNEVAIPYVVGDTIDIYNPENMEFIDTFKIVDIAKIGTSYTLTVDKRPSKVKVGQTVGNASKITKMTLDNCIIRNKRNRGILLQSRKSKIINCTFQNVVMGAIQVLAVNDIFKEAIVPQDIEIANNKFLNNYNDLSVFAYGDNPSKCVSGTIKNVDIHNNYFFNGHGDTIWILANTNTKIYDNLIHYSKALTSVIMDISTSSDVNVYNNVLYNLTTSNMQMIVSTSCTNLTNENNEERSSL